MPVLTGIIIAGWGQSLQAILDELPEIMQREMNRMWASKMGLAEFNAELFTELHTLMAETPVDYTLFWRELSNLPTQVAQLKTSFYETRGGYAQNSAAMEAYRSATDSGDFSLVHKLHDVLADPYSEQTEAVAALYYKKKEEKFFNLGGTSHCSCSS